MDEPPSHNSGGSTPGADPAEFAGRVTRRKIRAGEPVHIGMLLARRDVERGQSVAVEVRSGAARLTFDGRAESTGKTGDQILVRNQATGKRFRATIDGGPGRVSVGALSEMENSNASDNLERSSTRVDRLSAVHGGTQKAGR
jgi:flagella basal body P-ring formation protein FlgA